MNLAQEIETLIRARYPILYIISSEETRVQTLLIEIAEKRQKKIFEWSYSTGIVPAGTSIQSQKHRNTPTKDPLLALDQEEQSENDSLDFARSGNSSRAGKRGHRAEFSVAEPGRTQCVARQNHRRHQTI